MKIFLGVLQWLYYWICYPFIIKDKRLKVLHNSHVGEDCFIIGLGPSLNINDLDTLNKADAFCFSMNNVDKVFSKTKWRPNVYFVSDPIIAKQSEFEEKVIRLDKDGVITLCPKNVFPQVPSCMIRYVKNFSRNKFYKIANGCIVKGVTKFSKNAYHQIYDGSSCVHSIIQLAYYMGFNTIYLLGVDCGSSSTLDYSPLIGEKSKGVYASLTVSQRLIMDFESLNKSLQMSKTPLKIINATRGGFLEVFPREKIDNIIK